MSTENTVRDYPPPIVTGDPPQIHEPPRSRTNDRTSRDKFRRVNASDYYEFAAKHYNELHADKPHIHLQLFQDELSGRRRNEMHKRIINDILMDRLPDVCRNITFSQARLKDWRRMKDVFQEISYLPDFLLYKKHSRQSWLVKKLIDQRMETKLRSVQAAKKRAGPKEVRQIQIATPVMNLDLDDQNYSASHRSPKASTGNGGIISDGEEQEDGTQLNSETANEIARSGPGNIRVPDLNPQHGEVHTRDENQSEMSEEIEIDEPSDQELAASSRIIKLREELIRLETLAAETGKRPTRSNLRLSANNAGSNDGCRKARSKPHSSGKERKVPHHNKRNGNGQNKNVRGNTGEQNNEKTCRVGGRNGRKLNNVRDSRESGKELGKNLVRKVSACPDSEHSLPEIGKPRGERNRGVKRMKQASSSGGTSRKYRR